MIQSFVTKMQTRTGDDQPHGAISMRRSSAGSSTLFAVMCMLLIALSGCTTTVSPEYGVSEGFVARRSPGGLSAFRTLTEQSGATTYTVRSLSPANKERLEAIVWLPDSFAPHRPETFEWLEQWMLEGDKTLVYIGRDYSPIGDYWQKASTSDRLKGTNGSLSLAAREEAARYQAILDADRAGVRTQIPTPWFGISHQASAMRKVTAFSGEWSDIDGSSSSNIYVRSVIEPFDANTVSAYKLSFDNKPKTSQSTPVVQKGTYDEQWTTTDESMLDVAKKINENDVPLVTTLLASDDGTPLITLLESNNWTGSRVIYVANTSILCNLGMTYPNNRKIADKLLSEFWGQTTGFINEPIDPAIRKDNNLDQQKGFEMLTVWPLNVITIHAVFTGLLILLAVFPIFGRPQTIPKVSTTDFANHVDAVGILLRKAGDQFYALSTIADYFKLVRKDTTSPWASVDTLHVQRVDSPFASTPTAETKPAEAQQIASPSTDTASTIDQLKPGPPVAQSPKVEPQALDDVEIIEATIVPDEPTHDSKPTQS